MFTKSGACTLFLLHGCAVFLMCHSKYSRLKTAAVCGVGAALEIILFFRYEALFTTPESVYFLFSITFLFALCETLALSAEALPQTLFVFLTYAQVFITAMFLAGMLSNLLFAGNRYAYVWLRTAFHLLALVIYALFLKKRVERVRGEVPEGWWPMCFLSLLFTVYIGYITMKAQASSFQEMNVAGFIFLLAAMLLGNAVIFYALHYMHEVFLNRQIEQHQKILFQKLEMLQSAEEEARRVRHDTRHHLLNIAEYARNGENEALLRYIGEYDREVARTGVPHMCQNLTIDNILTVYAQRAKQNGIMAEYDIEVQGEIAVRDVDLVAILANLLENAINGCMHSQKEEKHLKVRMRTKTGKLSILVENTCAEEISFENGLPVSEHRKGVGISSILKSLEKYGGNADFKCENGIFTSRAVLKHS